MVRLLRRFAVLVALFLLLAIVLLRATAVDVPDPLQDPREMVAGE